MSSEPTFAVSILVSSKDRRELLRQAVASLRDLDYPEDLVEIVVVEETEEPEDPGADRYLSLPREGKGFAFSRNVALRAASHDLVAFTDDDCLVDRRWLRELVAPFEDPEIGAVAGGVLAQPSGVLGRTEIVLGFPGGGLRRIATSNGKRWSPTRELSTVNAAARRELLVGLGGFREETGVYGGEDSELFTRLTERYRAVFNPRALVFHRARDSVRGIARWLYRRGIAEVALTRLDRDRRRHRLVQHTRNSMFLRGVVILAAIVTLELPVVVTLAGLAALYYTAQLWRYRFALRAMGFRVFLLSPVTKLLMDLSFEIGRMKGFAMWFTGRFARVDPVTDRTEAMLARVLFVENSGTIVGGGQVSLLQLIEGLDRSRFHPVVVCPGEGEFLEAVQRHEVPAFIIPMASLRRGGWWSFPGTVLALWKLMRFHRIDLVHVNGSRAMIYAGITARLASRPVLWHVRVLESDGILDRVLARLSSRVIVNSEAVRHRFDFLEHRNGNAPVVVPNGVDLQAFQDVQPEPVFSRQWRCSGGHVLVVLAQLIPWKRQDLAIEMLAVLRERGVDAGLVLIGDEVPATRGYRSQLEERAEKLGVQDHCFFVGFRRDAPALLKIADLLIHPATPEPFGRALIEAMAAEVPVVAAAGGGVEEIVEDGVSGRIVRSSDPAVWADVVEELLRDPEERQSMARAGRRRVEEQFSIEEHVGRIERLYQEVLEGS